VNLRSRKVFFIFFVYLSYHTTRITKFECRADFRYFVLGGLIVGGLFKEFCFRGCSRWEDGIRRRIRSRIPAKRGGKLSLF